MKGDLPRQISRITGPSCFLQLVHMADTGLKKSILKDVTLCWEKVFLEKLSEICIIKISLKSWTACLSLTPVQHKDKNSQMTSA